MARPGKRKSRLREKMIVAANELFEEQGGDVKSAYDAVTIDMIVERSGVSRRSFFNHFSGKADVLLTDLATTIKAHLDALENRPAEEPAFLAAINAYRDISVPWAENPVNWKRAKRQAALPNMRPNQWFLVGEWERRLAEALESRITGRERGLLASLTASVAIAVIRTSTEEWYRIGVDQPRDGIFRRVAELAPRVFEDG